MELRQLRYFVAIAECGSFTKAAERVFVAQSALSHQTAQLEFEIGTRLFHRARRGLELTEAGQRFLPHAMSILRQSEEAIASARNATDEPCGKVIFGLPHSASNALALALLQGVREHLPALELELTEELTGNLSRQLMAGQINLANLLVQKHFHVNCFASGHAPDTQARQRTLRKSGLAQRARYFRGRLTPFISDRMRCPHFGNHHVIFGRHGKVHQHPGAMLNAC